MSVVFQPHPGKQTQIFTSPADQLLAGGGKKSGKSACAIAKHLRHVNDPRYRGLVIRRTIPGLKHIEGKARALYRRVCPTVEHNLTQHTFTFPNVKSPREPGAQILFSFAETLADCEKFEGGGYQGLVVDEARQWSDPLILDTIAAELYADIDEATGQQWMKPWQLYTSNPGGAGGDWLRERFAIDKYPKGSVDIFDPGSGLYRMYLHMTVRDNPSVDAQKYIAQLKQFPIWKQRQMIEGNWFQKEGSAFEEVDPEVHYIESFDWKGWDIHRSMDYGYSTMGICHYWAVHPDYNATVCIDELQFTRVRPRDMARAMVKLERDRGYRNIVNSYIGRDASTDDSSETNPRRAMGEEGIYWQFANTSREAGYQAICARLATHITLHDGTTVPSIRFVQPRCPYLCRTLPILPQKPNCDDIDKEACKRANGNKGNDHGADSLRYHVTSLPLPESEPVSIERFAGVPDFERTSSDLNSMKAYRPRGF